LLSRVVEDLFGEEFEDDEVVLAKVHVVLRGGDNLGDEVWPVVRPLLLENLNEDEVELSEVGLLRPEGRVVGGGVDDDLDDKVADCRDIQRHARLQHRRASPPWRSTSGNAFHRVVMSFSMICAR
jgi:hypothetical protein